MIGGEGDDAYQVDDNSYQVDDVGDVVVEASGGGIDTVCSSVNYFLAAGREIETLRVLGSVGLTLTGNEFDNYLVGAAGDDVLDSGTGDDRINGDAGNDILTTSGAGATIDGGSGEDVLIGNEGRDILNGGADNDRLNGGAGYDILTDGTGSDTFVFDTPIVAGDNIDRITDFTSGSDTIEINQEFYFTGLALGQLDPAQFAVGNATGAGPQIVYNAVSGALFYDVNGAGAGGAAKFAILTGAPALVASDFLIV